MHSIKLRLNDLNRAKIGRNAHLSTQLRDSEQDFGVQLTIQGSPELIKNLLEEIELHLTIQHGTTTEQWEAKVREFVSAHQPLSLIGSKNDLSKYIEAPKFKAMKTPIRAANTVVIALERTRPGGTFYVFSIPGLSIPAGANVLVTMPWSVSTVGFSFPRSGNPDLFLHNRSAASPIFAASTAFGLAPDSVAWVDVPWAFFIPVYRISARSAGQHVLDFTTFTLTFP